MKALKVVWVTCFFFLLLCGPAGLEGQALGARDRHDTPTLVLLASARADTPSPIDMIEHFTGATNVNAVAGHGRLTVGISMDGDLTVLAWPSPGFADQLGYFTSNDLFARDEPHFGADDRMGSYVGLLVTAGGQTSLTWLRDAPWTHAQSYSAPDAPVPITTFTHPGLGLVVTVTDVVLPDTDVLSRDVRIARQPGSPVTGVSLVTYENLSPTLSHVPELPYADWMFDPQNDFLALWDEASRGILHFHPGDRGVLRSFSDILQRGQYLDYGPVEALMKTAQPGPGQVNALVASLDRVYQPGVAALVTTDPPPSSHQVGTDNAPMCELIGHMIDNLLALPTIFPGLPLPVSPDLLAVARCTDQLPGLATQHGWVYSPQDARADLLDGALSGSRVAAAQTNGALITCLPFEQDVAQGSVLFAFGATRQQARAALLSARARSAAARQQAAEAAAHAALGALALPDPALGPRVQAVAQRALVNLYVARDQQSGAFLASISRQPPYYLDWPRDGAFISVGMDLAGRPDWVTQRGLWYAGLPRALPAPPDFLSPNAPIDPDLGIPLFPAHAWEMNYYVDRAPGGTIRFEIDNTALHVFAMIWHAARLAEPARRTFASAIWPSTRDALDLLARWREADTGLQAPANEDDNPALTSTLHGASVVYAALTDGARLAHYLGDEEQAQSYLLRSQELGAAILQYYADPTTGLFRSVRGGPSGPQGGPTGWLAWPGRLLQDLIRQNDGNPALQQQLAAQLEGQLQADMGLALAMVTGLAPGGGYPAKNILPAILYGQPGGARDMAEQALQLLANVATPDTDHFGEVWLYSGGTPPFSDRVATPHVWEGMLFYLSAMALSGPDAIHAFNVDQEAFPLP